jgi:hypothetical protein
MNGPETSEFSFNRRAILKAGSATMTGMAAAGVAKAAPPPIRLIAVEEAGPVPNGWTPWPPWPHRAWRRMKSARSECSRISGTFTRMFAIDYPCGRTEEAVSFIRSAPFPADKLERIAFCNAERLFGIKPAA